MDQQKSFYQGKEAILSFNVSEFTEYNNLTFQLYSKNAENFESIYITLTEKQQFLLNPNTIDEIQENIVKQNQTQCTNNQKIYYDIKVNEQKNQQIETIQTIQILVLFETEKLIIYFSIGLIIVIFSVALFMFWKIKFLLNFIGKNLTYCSSNIANNLEDDKKFYQEKCFICNCKLLNGKNIAQTPCKNEIHEKCLDLHNQRCLFCIVPNRQEI